MVRGISFAGEQAEFQAAETNGVLVRRRTAGLDASRVEPFLTNQQLTGIFDPNRV
jgi:hypothetical protein